MFDKVILPVHNLHFALVLPLDASCIHNLKSKYCSHFFLKHAFQTFLMEDKLLIEKEIRYSKLTVQQIYQVFILQIYLFHDGCSYNELIHDISMIKISRITAQKHITSGLNQKKPNLIHT